MATKKKTKEEKVVYWDINPILKFNAHYNVIFGERSNGKTYGVLQYGLEQYFKDKKEMAYIRRWEEDIKGSKAKTLFSPLVNNGVIAKLSKGKYTDVVYNNRAYYLARQDEKDENKMILNKHPFCYSFALNQAEHYKSSSYPKVETIIFDEFMTRKIYLNDEFIEFQHLLSTIIRLKDTVKIFMVGNTVNQYCPYFSEMGLTNVSKQEVGTIELYTYANTTLRVAVNFADFPSKNKASNVYFAFNNPKLQMIRGDGAVWEIGVYPHLPVKYDERDIKFTYFIVFDNTTMQCEVIRTRNKDKESGKELDDYVTFTYVHRKTTELRDTSKNLVYQKEFDARPNYRRRLTKPFYPIEKKLVSFFNMDKVFYQDNELGEVMRNYLLWSNSASITN